ncbi:MAG TPA: AsmA-like C-terminal region-containing protein [Candidatus Saccharimonadales bacterium]|nr:AsmA-like C-terminal region-containing protein [Candidatus Saccharimonadales bacterium]
MANVNRTTMPVPSREMGFGWLRVFSYWWMWILLVVAMLAVTAFVILLRYFPYSKKKIMQSLQETFPSAITIDHFQQVYFPHPGCKAEGILFRSFSSPPESQPIVAIHELTIQGSYADLIFRPHHISKVFLDSLHLYFSPINNSRTFSGGSTQTAITIGQLIANGAVMEVERADKKPVLRFDFHELSFESVSDKNGISYSVVMHNPEPRAEIRSTGHFGPLNDKSAGQTPVSGKYTFDGGDLAMFKGIAGIVNSVGTFSGSLGEINVQGITNTPDFEVVRSGHSGPLHTEFQAKVNSLNGDVALTSVDANYIKTNIKAKGVIAGIDGSNGKYTSLEFVIAKGRIDDVLRLFVKENRPPLSGITRMQGHVVIPPDGEPFLKKVSVQGDFEIEDGQFENRTRQESVDELSETARGKKKPKDEDKDSAENVISHLNGHTSLRNGVATFSGLAFQVPGADASMHGTFNLLNQKIDLHGTLKMDAKFSQSTSGIKSLFAKVLNPFFDKSRGSVVPVLVDGTYQNPHFGLDLNPVKNKDGGTN